MSVLSTNDWMAHRFLEALLAFMLFEFVALAGWLARRGHRRLVGLAGLYLLSGATLIAAVRLALVAETARFVWLAMGVSLVAHVAFLSGTRRRCLGPLAPGPSEAPLR
jgi:hypothetical protein